MLPIAMFKVIDNFIGKSFIIDVAVQSQFRDYTACFSPLYGTLQIRVTRGWGRVRVDASKHGAGHAGTLKRLPAQP